MADLSQLEEALRNADKAGATEDATRLATEIKRMRGASSTGGPEKPEAEPSSVNFVTGNINKGIANVAGMPVDFARNVMNLGVAGYGAAKGALGGKPPDLIPPGVGGSDWFERMMTKGGMIGPSAEPESTAGRYMAAGLQALPGAALGRPNLTQLPRALTGAFTSGVGSELGRQIAPEGYEQAGAVVGALAPGARGMAKIPAAGERATAERQAQRYEESKSLGIPVPPRAMKPDRVQQKIQNAVAKELRLPEGTELTPDTLQAYRNAHYQQGYVALQNEPALKGVINVTPVFRRKVDAIAREEKSLRDEFPNSVKDVGLQQVIDDFRQSPFFTVEGTMQQIKRLRESASRNLSSASANDDTIRVGLTQKKLAGQLEGLVEENLKQIGKPEVLKTFRDARKAMAQSHAVEDSLDRVTRQINPTKLSALETEGAPLSGQLKRIAEISGEFPSAFRKESQSSEDLFTHRVTPMAVMHPPAMAAHWLSRLLEPLTLSRPYQAFSVNPRARLTPEQERFMRLAIGASQGNQLDPPPQ